MDSAAAEAHRNERVAFWLQPVRRVVAERQRLRQKITELFVQVGRWRRDRRRWLQ